jgi:hypothetical protein
MKQLSVLERAVRVYDCFDFDTFIMKVMSSEVVNYVLYDG